MKKCHRCQKPATLHITEIKSGEVQELHLCESCAQEYLKYADSAEPEDAEGLAAKLAEVSGDQDLEEIDQLVCPNCGITFKEFRSQGRLGCPHDYIAFEDELLPLLENIHGETQHCGKFPKRAPDASRRQYQLIKLRTELRTAIEEEHYETAARLRDDIQKLETKLQQADTESD
ncbi:MAG: UvrB/UvrC motif-containing protein [Planctomycetales bacterium]